MDQKKLYPILKFLTDCITYYPADQYPSQIIEKSKEKQKEKLARVKQLKDDYAVRKREVF